MPLERKWPGRTCECGVSTVFWHMCIRVIHAPKSVSVWARVSRDVATLHGATPPHDSNCSGGGWPCGSYRGAWSSPAAAPPAQPCAVGREVHFSFAWTHCLKILLLASPLPSAIRAHQLQPFRSKKRCLLEQLAGGRAAQ